MVNTKSMLSDTLLTDILRPLCHFTLQGGPLIFVSLSSCFVRKSDTIATARRGVEKVSTWLGSLMRLCLVSASTIKLLSWCLMFVTSFAGSSSVPISKTRVASSAFKFQQQRQQKQNLTTTESISLYIYICRQSACYKAKLFSLLERVVFF